MNGLRQRTGTSPQVGASSSGADLQSGVAAIGTAGIEAGVNGVGDVHWLTVASVALLATVLSVATSVGNADFTAGK